MDANFLSYCSHSSILPSDSTGLACLSYPFLYFSYPNLPSSFHLSELYSKRVLASRY